MVFNKKNIVAVDDSGLVLKMLIKVLGEKYELHVFNGGRRALQFLKDRTPDLIILDIDMPEMSGIETFEHMKDYEVKVPVIFLTASGLEEDVVNAIRLGAVNYLKKPFRPQELMKRVSQEFAKQ